MAPRTLVTIVPHWQHMYRKPGASMTGVVEAVSPNGAIARVRLDYVQSSYVLVAHLEEIVSPTAP